MYKAKKETIQQTGEISNVQAYAFDRTIQAKRGDFCVPTQACSRLSVNINNHSPGLRPLLQTRIHIRDLIQTLDAIQRLDVPVRGDVERLDGVLTIADVGPDESLGEEDGEEDAGFDHCVGGEADCYDGAVRTDVLHCLLVGGAAGGGDDGGWRENEMR